MLILASRSPRRRELLGLITKDFSVVLGEEDETLPPGTPPEEAVRILAERKAETVYRKHPLDVVIGADTLVVCEGETLGKPENEADAARMLRLLSGRTHSVFTGVCIKAPGRRETFAERSAVTFYSLSDEEIAAYVASGEPMDKAGAYGIQEQGALLVRRIEGDYFNIVGLPVARLHQLLQKTALFRPF